MTNRHVPSAGWRGRSHELAWLMMIANSGRSPPAPQASSLKPQASSSRRSAAPSGAWARPPGIALVWNTAPCMQDARSVWQNQTGKLGADLLRESKNPQYMGPRRAKPRGRPKRLHPKQAMRPASPLAVREGARGPSGLWPSSPADSRAPPCSRRSWRSWRRSTRRCRRATSLPVASRRRGRRRRRRRRRPSSVVRRRRRPWSVVVVVVVVSRQSSSSSSASAPRIVLGLGRVVVIVLGRVASPPLCGLKPPLQIFSRVDGTAPWNRKQEVLVQVEVARAHGHLQVREGRDRRARAPPPLALQLLELRQVARYIFCNL